MRSLKSKNARIVAPDLRLLLLPFAVPRNEIYWPRVLLMCVNAGLAATTIAAGFPWPLMWAAFAAHSTTVLALFLPHCTWLGPSVRRFASSSREVWLTIDDGPDGENTSELAAALSARGVRATFFVKGQSLSSQPAAAQALLQAGHTLANHTTTHPIGRFWCLSRRRLRSEIDDCNEALRQCGVSTTRWFRSPLGFKNFLLHSELRRRGMRLVGWSARGHDGIASPIETVVRRVAKAVKPGAIVLLHEGMPQSNETILRVVDMLLAERYSFAIPADEALL